MTAIRHGKHATSREVARAAGGVGGGPEPRAVEKKKQEQVVNIRIGNLGTVPAPKIIKGILALSPLCKIY